MTIQDVMKKHINVKIDEEYYNKLNRYRVGWCNKSQDYTEFLGSGLTGVHAIRFSDLDTDKLYTDILNVEQIKGKLLELDYVKDELKGWNK